MNQLKTTDNRIELWLSPHLEDKFRQIFEIEMLQGVRKVQDDGIVYLSFESTPEKVTALKRAMVQAIFKQPKIFYN